MSTKFYHAENCNRKISSNGTDFTFEVYDKDGGTWMGVYAATDEAQQKALDALVADKRSAVTEISEDSYNHSLKKKPNSPISLPTLNPPPAPNVPTQLQGDRPAVVVEDPQANEAAALTEEPKLEAADAIQVGDVAPSPAQAEVTHKGKKKK